MIEARNVTLGYRKETILSGIDVTFWPGQMVAIIGANGSGKSTLLQALAGLHPFETGEIYIHGKPLQRWTRRKLARYIAYLGQSPQAPEDLSVVELVEHGTFASKSLFRIGQAGSINDVLERMNLTEYADLPFHTLSGGERQRTWIALTLIQKAKMLLLDEPTSALDMGYQLEMLGLLRQLVDEDHVGCIVVIHEINQASQFFDRIIALHDGQIFLDGPPKDVIRPDTVSKLFGTPMTVLRDQTGQHPYCVPLGRLTFDNTDSSQIVAGKRRR